MVVEMVVGWSRKTKTTARRLLPADRLQLHHKVRVGVVPRARLGCCVEFLLPAPVRIATNLRFMGSDFDPVWNFWKFAAWGRASRQEKRREVSKLPAGRFQGGLGIRPDPARKS